MCREDGGNVNLPLLGQWQRDTGKPFVEVGDDGLSLLMAYKLRFC